MKDDSAGAIPLKNDRLADLPETVDRPLYDRAALRPGIVHIGLGNFHRAHQAWYLHRLMQAGQAQDWAIIGAGVRAYDSEMRDRLRAQDHLTTLIELGTGAPRAEVTGAMIDYVPVSPDNAPLIAAMADPRIRIVSLTVTEGGYFLDPATGGLDVTAPDIAHDADNPATPRTAFGAMVAALKLRREAGHRPFTGQSCDNLQGNGDILRQTIIGLARLSDPDLAEWIAAEGAFPNSMVDCIVPATGDAERGMARHLGVLDNAPVTHEDFRQWVIEDAFCDGRPDWDQVGATFTHDVHAYEMMKIRMLNAGHQVLANAGELLGLDTIADCMGHTGVSGFFDRVEREEIAPYVAPVPGMTPDAYLALISKRFQNPAVRDTTRRVAFDGSARHTGFVMPVLQDALAAGGSVTGLALVEALWARMCFGTREDGSEIAANDPHWESLVTAAKAARDDPSAWRAQTQYYGDLAEAPPFATAFDAWLTKLWAEGTEATLKAYLSEGAAL